MTAPKKKLGRRPAPRKTRAPGGGRKPLPESERKVPIKLSISPEAREIVDQQGKGQGSRFVEGLILNYGKGKKT
jgi:hypothetical protein